MIIEARNCLKSSFSAVPLIEEQTLQEVEPAAPEGVDVVDPHEEAV